MSNPSVNTLREGPSEYFSFPSVESFDDGRIEDGGSALIPKLLDRVKSALVGSSSALTSEAKPLPPPAVPQTTAQEQAIPSDGFRARSKPAKRWLRDDTPEEVALSDTIIGLKKPGATLSFDRRSRAQSIIGLHGGLLPSSAAQTPSVGVTSLGLTILQHPNSTPVIASSGPVRSHASHPTFLPSVRPRPLSASSHHLNRTAGRRNSLVHARYDDISSPSSSSDAGLGGSQPRTPHFSQIPGFPLARDTLADDNGSVKSFMTGPRRQEVERSEAFDMLARRVKGVSKEYWMPDEDVKECNDCAAKFTAWRRKHHCRICGQIFCSTCASHLIPADRYGAHGWIRACNICFDQREPDGDDATSERGGDPPDPAGGTYSWTASLSSIHNLLSTSQRIEPLSRVDTPVDPPSPRPTAKRLIDYIVHDRELVSESQSPQSGPPTRKGTPDGRWTDGRQAVGEGFPLPPEALHKSSQNQVATASAPFRKGLADEEDQSMTEVVDGDDLATYEASVSADQASLPEEPRSGGPEEQGSPLPRPEGHEAFPTDGTETEEPTDDHLAPVRARVISRPLMPYLASLSGGNWGLDITRTPATATAPSATRQRRNSAGIQHDAELTVTAHAHLKSMIRQCLEREQIPNAGTWERELLRLMGKISRHPVPDVANGAEADIRHIVKIKKIPGGTPADCEFVDGVVCTKNVIHKRMPRLIVNPRVVCLGMPLEYSRVEGKFIRLDTLHTQEKQYLKSLVDRVLKLRPHVVLVEGNVPGYAVDLFVEAGVAVARNLKGKSLQAIARCTQATVMSSLDRLTTQPALGRAGLYQIQTFAHSLIPGRRKTFIRLEGCPPDLGATLVLRGGDLQLLAKIKAITNLLVYVTYSLKLECYYTRDESAFLGRGTPQQLTRRQCASVVELLRKRTTAMETASEQSVEQPESDQAVQLIEDVVRPYEVVILSGSPNVNFGVPHPLAQLRSIEHRLAELRQRRNAEEAAQILRDEKASMKSRTHSPAPSQASINHDHDQEKEQGDPSPTARDDSATPLCALQTSEQVQLTSSITNLEHARTSQTAIANSYLAMHPNDFDPLGHQKIIVQESVVRRDGRMCRGPNLREFSFYKPGEQPIGRLVEQLVACEAEGCTVKGCGEVKRLHKTQYVHGDFCATIRVHRRSGTPSDEHGSVEALDPTLEPGNERLILMEGFCAQCDGHTPKTKMSEDSWRLGFGKYLELCFYSPGHIAGPVIRRESGLRVPCVHDAHREHTRHFFHRGFRVEIAVTPIKVYDVHLPPTILTVRAETQLRLRNDEFHTIQDCCNAYFDSVRARIAAFNHDLVPVDRQEKSRETLAGMLHDADRDQAAIRAQLVVAYKTTEGTNGVRMNTVRKTLVDKAVAWDHEFTTFELKFVAPPEKDVRRLTSVQLRKLFSDPSVPASPEKPFSVLGNGSLAAPDAEAPASAPPPGLHAVASALAFSLPGSLPSLPLPDLPIAGSRSPFSKNRNEGPEQDATRSSDSGGRGSSESAKAAREEPPMSAPAAPAVSNPPDSCIAENDSPPQSSTAVTSIVPSISGDRESEEATDSDSTVVDSYERSRRISFGSRETTTRSLQSDADTASELDVQHKHFQRSRKVKPSASVASLVQKFDGAGSTPLPEASAKRLKPSKVPRPTLRRGKSEGIKTVDQKSDVMTPTDAVSDGEGCRHAPHPLLGSSGRTSRSSGSSSSRNASKAPDGNGNPTRSDTLAGPSSGTKGPSRRISSHPSVAKNPEVQPNRTIRGAPPLPGRMAKGAKGKEAVKLTQLLPSSTPGLSTMRRLGAPTKVSTIARHFDRMSKESERDRQRRVIMARGRRARPIAHAQSSVQTFSSLKAAVRGDSDEDGERSDRNEAREDADADDEEEAVQRMDDDEDRDPAKASQPVNVPVTVVNHGLDILTEESEGTSQEDADTAAGEGRSNPSPLPPSAAHSTAQAASASPVFTTEPLGLPASKLSVFSESEMSSSDTGKTSLMKTLSSLWNYRGADFLPLQYPQLNTEHQSAENPDIVIREDEPSSIIAYTLSSKLYRDTLRDLGVSSRVTEKAESFMPDEELGHGMDRSSTWGMIEIASEGTDFDDSLRTLSVKPVQFRFDLDPCTVTCKVFFMHQFDVIRRNSQCQEQFIESLARCIKWDSVSGGKSGQHFLKTKDDRFIIKGISKVELEGLTKFAPAYFEHLSSATRNARPSALAKTLGIFQISFVNRVTGKKGKLQVQVQENLWADKPKMAIFDLKGLVRNRTAVPSGKLNEVLLDGNFLERCKADPIFVHETSLLQLQASLFNDTSFLARNVIMDYSLICGIDAHTQQLHIGIIDYLRTYSWDKRLETLVKEFGGGANKEAPTVITPTLYKARFRSSMARYFTLSPDAWTGQWNPFLARTDAAQPASSSSQDASKSANEALAHLARSSVFR